MCASEVRNAITAEEKSAKQICALTAVELVGVVRRVGHRAVDVAVTAEHAVDAAARHGALEAAMSLVARRTVHLERNASRLQSCSQSLPDDF